MATAWVTEYRDVKSVLRSGPAGLPKTPSVANQTVTYTTTTQSNAFNSLTNYIRFVSTSNCHILINADPTATTSTTYVPAGAVEYFGVTPGHKIAVVAAA